MPRILQAVLILAVFAAVFAPLTVLAHGMERVVAQDLPAGPYLVTFTSQSVVTPGAARVAVQVRVAATGEEVEAIAVRVWLAPPGAEGDRRGPFDTVRGEPSPPIHYDTTIQTDAVGMWTATIVIEGPAGPGTASTPMAVVESRTTLFVIAAIVMGLVFLGLLGLVYRIVGEKAAASEGAR